MKKNLLLLFISWLLYGSIGSTYAGKFSKPTTNSPNWSQIQAIDILNVVGKNTPEKPDSIESIIEDDVTFTNFVKYVAFHSLRKILPYLDRFDEKFIAPAGFLQTIVDIVFPLFYPEIYDRISLHATDGKKTANEQMYSKIFIRTAYLYALPLAIYNVEFIVDDLKLAFNIEENDVVEIKNELSKLHEYLKWLYGQINSKVDYPERQERTSFTASHRIEKRKRTDTEAELPFPYTKRKLVEVDYPERQERTSFTASHRIKKRKRTDTEAELPFPYTKRKLVEVDYPERQERTSFTASYEIEKRKRTDTEAELPRPDAKRKLAR